MKSRLVPVFTFCLILFGASLARAAETGAVKGQISNAATGDFLQGAIVTALSTNQTTVTDRAGRYEFAALPAGSVTLEVSFAGLDTKRVAVEVSSAAPATRDIALTSELYKLDAFVVAGEREGTAKSEQRQREAPNVKNIISGDTFGNRADANIANVLENVEGVNALWNDAEARQVSIRGVEAEMNTVTIDGQPMASSTAGTARRFDFDAQSLGNIESIEVTKAATPDMDGAAVGGNVNLITRSAFDRQAGRMFNYALGLTHQPTFRADAPRWKEPIPGYGGFGNFNYTDVLGEKKNIGISLTGSWHNMQLNHIRSTLIYGANDPVNEPTYVTQQNRHATLQNRTKALGGAKIDYRLSDHTELSFGVTYVWSEVTSGLLQMLGSTPATLATIDANGNRTGGGFVSPNFADGVTRLFPTPTASYTFTTSQDDSITRTYVFNPSVHQHYPGLDIRYALTYSNAANYGDKDVPPEGSVTGKLANIGYNIDRHANGDFPVITQTAGPSIYDLNNYSGLQLNKNVANGRAEVLNIRLDVKKDLPFELPTYLKAGGAYGRQYRRLGSENHRYNYKGADGIAGNADDSQGYAQFLDTTGKYLSDSDYRKYLSDAGKLLPFPSTLLVAQNQAKHPELWSEDVANGTMTTLQAYRKLVETIKAAYVMGNVRFGKLSVLGGVRFEETTDDGKGPLNYLSPEEKARQAAWVGPVTDAEAVRRVIAQYGNIQTNHGRYHNYFPSVHFRYEPFRGLVTRASWSVGIGRPAFGSIIPNDTVNYVSQTVTHNNPSLQPEKAVSYDWTAEYYFKPQGSLQLGLFRKDISNYIFTDSSQTVGTGPDNGFNGDYAGYTLTTMENRGKAKIEGLEMAYNQRLTFLPGWAKGFGLNASYTVMRTEGDYGAAPGVKPLPFNNSSVQSFLPHSGAAGISYRGHKWDLRFQAVYRGQYLYQASTIVASQHIRKQRIMLNWKSTYDLTRHLSLFLDVDNLNSAPISDNYLLYPDRKENYATFAPKIQFGFMGRF